jgi:hypothetical protein
VPRARRANVLDREDPNHIPAQAHSHVDERPDAERDEVGVGELGGARVAARVGSDDHALGAQGGRVPWMVRQDRLSPARVLAGSSLEEFGARHGALFSLDKPNLNALHIERVGHRLGDDAQGLAKIAGVQRRPHSEPDKGRAVLPAPPLSPLVQFPRRPFLRHVPHEVERRRPAVPLEAHGAQLKTTYLPVSPAHSERVDGGNVVPLEAAGVTLLNDRRVLRVKNLDERRLQEHVVGVSAQRHRARVGEADESVLNDKDAFHRVLNDSAMALLALAEGVPAAVDFLLQVLAVAHVFELEPSPVVGQLLDARRASHRRADGGARDRLR